MVSFWELILRTTRLAEEPKLPVLTNGKQHKKQETNKLESIQMPIGEVGFKAIVFKYRYHSNKPTSINFQSDSAYYLRRVEKARLGTAIKAAGESTNLKKKRPQL